MRKEYREQAVSEIVGEMMMVTIVLILVAIFAANAGNLLPPPRDPTVTIVTDWEQNPMNPDHIDILLYHKGGDWVKTSDLAVIVSDHEKTILWKYLYNNESLIFQPDPDSQSFNLGDRIVITGVPHASYEVQLVTSRAVLFSDEVKTNE